MRRISRWSRRFAADITTLEQVQFVMKGGKIYKAGWRAVE